MESCSHSPVAPPRRRRELRLTRLNLEVAAGNPAKPTVIPRKSLAPSQMRPGDGVDGSTTTVMASVPTTLSCKNIVRNTRDRSVTNYLQEAVKKPQKPPPLNLSRVPPSPKTNQLSRSMNTTSHSSNKADTISRSCSVQNLPSKLSSSFSGNSSTESSKQKPARPTQKPARPNPPKRRISKAPNAALAGSSCSPGLKLPSASALQLAYSRNDGLGGSSPSASRLVQEDKVAIVNSREKHWERKQSREDVDNKMRVCNTMPRSSRPLINVRDRPNNKVQQEPAVTPSMFSKSRSLPDNKVKARTLPRSGTSGTQVMLSPHLPPARPPRPVLPSSTRPIFKANKDSTSSNPSQSALDNIYAYVDVSSGWNDMPSKMSQQWFTLKANSKYGNC